MKKLAISIIILIILLSIFGTVIAVEEIDTTNTNTASELIEIKEETKTEMDDYIRKYGSESYGTAAFILNKVRIYSIPFCFIGIVVGAIYQYVIGIRKLDVRDKGFKLIIGFVTLFVICQVLPLIFAVVVKSWRG